MSESKTYPKEYVIQLREEAKRYRLKAKAIEDQRRNLLERLVIAEIKGMESIDPALVLRLLDSSKVMIDNNGVITGLKEAVDALIVDYPAIKRLQTTCTCTGRWVEHHPAVQGITVITAGSIPFTVSYNCQ